MKSIANAWEGHFPTISEGLQTQLQELLKERATWFQRKDNIPLLQSLNDIPPVPDCHTSIQQGIVTVEAGQALSPHTKDSIKKFASDLIAWRKGPFDIFGLAVDAEWDSRQKWNRLKEHLPPLENTRILDIGASSGYYMFRMAEHNPQLILGIDPSVKFKLQFEFIQKYAKHPALFYELLGVEHVNLFPQCFDVVFCMGILYHRRDPIQMLETVKACMTAQGKLILETLIIPGEGLEILKPEKAYGKMRNVYALPTLNKLKDWCSKAGFNSIEVVNIDQTDVSEQRNTPYCPPPAQSLADFLDPKDSSKTIEGYPAHLRATLILE